MMDATVVKKCQWVLLETHVYHVSMYLYKVDYMTMNTFMYAVITSNYNKVMLCALYRVVTIVVPSCHLELYIS